MPVTPESLVRHELVGLGARVADAPNEDLVGIEGKVVAETTNTLGIGRDSTAGDRVSHVPKEGTTVTFTLPSGTDVTVAGRRLVERPARRTEDTGEHTWR